MKANAPKLAMTLRKCWRTVGKTRIILPRWLEGIIVPLLKGKGGMCDPKNYRPLCILSHARKLVGKAIIAQMEDLVETDRAQFVFQEGIQIEQTSLRVAALLHDGILFILVLDLSKAYDTVLKELLIEKLKRCLP